jgi:glycosyltransferase involved in cell wall biosynthesis
MKVLWIVNSPLSHVRQHNRIGNLSSGSWLDAAFISLADKEIELIVLNFSKIDQSFFVGKHRFITLSGFKNTPKISQYEHKCLDRIFSSCKPDILIQWGTEYSFGLKVFTFLKDVPKGIYMQGIIGDIGTNYYSGLNQWQILRYTTIRDIILRETLPVLKRKFIEQSVNERAYLEMARNVILENGYSVAKLKSYYRGLTVYLSKLPIKSTFLDYEWNYDRKQPYTIMTILPSHPIKGIHILLEAISIVKEFYPNVILKIPGTINMREKSFFSLIRMKSYIRFLKSEIYRLKLNNNIEYLRIQSSNEMGEQLSKSHVFVMPSNVENHSASLIEALTVGIPSITSDCGGVKEIVDHGNTGFIYRYEEYELLASYILKLFASPDLAKRMGALAREFTVKSRFSTDESQNMLKIYREIIINSKDRSHH